MRFNIICETDEDGKYVVECTDLPGCLSEGDTLDEAMDNINEAIIGCLTSRLKCAKDKLLKKILQCSTTGSIFHWTRQQLLNMPKPPRASGDKHVSTFEAASWYMSIKIKYLVSVY